MQAIAAPSLSFSLLLPLLQIIFIKKCLCKQLLRLASPSPSFSPSSTSQNSGKYFRECTRLKPLFFRTITDNLYWQILI